MIDTRTYHAIHDSDKATRSVGFFDRLALQARQAGLSASRSVLEVDGVPWQSARLSASPFKVNAGAMIPLAPREPSASASASPIT